MNYYVVSEEELAMLRSSAFGAGCIHVQLEHGEENPREGDLEKSEAACRARPVQQYDIYNPISGESHLVWKEVKR